MVRLGGADRAVHARRQTRPSATFPVESLLRIHFMQQWFTLSDPAMEGRCTTCPCSATSPAWAAGMTGCPTRAPSCDSAMCWRSTNGQSESWQPSICCWVPKGLMLRSGTVVDATLISAPSSTRTPAVNETEMHQSKKGQQWFFGMKAHIGVDADSGLVHTVRGTSGNVNDVVEANSLLHGQETDVFADAGYQGAHKRPDAKDDVQWHVAMRPGLRKLLDKADPWML